MYLQPLDGWILVNCNCSLSSSLYHPLSCPLLLSCLLLLLLGPAGWISPSTKLPSERFESCCKLAISTCRCMHPAKWLASLLVSRNPAGLLLYSRTSLATFQPSERSPPGFLLAAKRPPAQGKLQLADLPSSWCARRSIPGTQKQLAGSSFQNDDHFSINFPYCRVLSRCSPFCYYYYPDFHLILLFIERN